MAKRSHIAVSVKPDEFIDKKLRLFKKKGEREGIVIHAKRMMYFESKSQKNRKRLMRAIKMEMLRRSQLRLS